jgi:hypothetical protein
MKLVKNELLINLMRSDQKVLRLYLQKRKQIT